MSAIRKYLVSETIAFRKTKEEFGGLSNMASGFSLSVNEVIIPTAEHLYQACRFPNHPKIQWDIINEKSPMKGKWIGRAKIKNTRKEWNEIQFKIMQWVLEVKLSQNWETFSSLLKSTGDKNIVEVTPQPKVWGAVKDGDYYEGVNALGRLLMYLRETYVKTNTRNHCVKPLDIPEFNFLGTPIGTISDEDKAIADEKIAPREFVFA